MIVPGFILILADQLINPIIPQGGHPLSVVKREGYGLLAVSASEGKSGVRGRRLSPPRSLTAKGRKELSALALAGVKGYQLNSSQGRVIHSWFARQRHYVGENSQQYERDGNGH